MRVSRFPIALPLAAALLCLTSPGCSQRHDFATAPTVAVDSPSTNAGPFAPVPDVQPGFYPLATGNHWAYQQEVVVKVVDVANPPPPERYTSILTVEIVQPASFGSREYLGELTTTFGPGGTSQFYSPIRQDATGLYEWSPVIAGARVASARPAVHITVPAGRPPAERAALEAAARRLEEKIATVHASLGGRMATGFTLTLPSTASPSEVTRLRYPLVPKAQWRIAQDRRFNSSARVIGRETIDLPPGPLAGYRIQVVSDFLGPHDSVTWWYGSAGFLQEVSHIEVAATDSTGGIVGRALFDEREWLTDYEIPPTHVVPPWPPRRPK